MRYDIGELLAVLDQEVRGGQMSINRVNISGNLTRDPELRATTEDVYKRQELDHR